MPRAMMLSVAMVIVGIFIGVLLFAPGPSAAADATTAPTTSPGIDLSTGWTLLQEGQAQGTIEQDAKHPTNPSPHLLRIEETRAAAPGEGRVGATSAIHFAVADGQWCDVTFSAATAGASIGLVFSLESSDGKVLARTTLPEIGGARAGRGRAGGGPAAAPAAWPKYLVSLHVCASDAGAHVTITPIEPTNVWLDGLTLTLRASGH